MTLDLTPPTIQINSVTGTQNRKPGCGSKGRNGGNQQTWLVYPKDSHTYLEVTQCIMLGGWFHLNSLTNEDANWDQHLRTLCHPKVKGRALSPPRHLMTQKDMMFAFARAGTEEAPTRSGPSCGASCTQRTYTPCLASLRHPSRTCTSAQTCSCSNWWKGLSPTLRSRGTALCEPARAQARSAPPWRSYKTLTPLLGRYFLHLDIPGS